MSRFQLARAIALAATLAGPGRAGASGGDSMLTGQVVSAQSRWARGGSAIITESVLRLDDGREVAVRQLGGSVDGIAMLSIPAPAILRAGDRVSAEVVVARDRSGRESRVVQRLWTADQPGTSSGSGAVGGGRMPFVRTVASRTHAPLAWESGCAIVTFQDAGTTHVAGDGEFAAMEASLARWMDATGDCSYLELRLGGRKSGEVGLDGTNLVVYREDRWCRPATDSDPEECYDPSAAGLTTLFFIDDGDSERNGAILDADVELNAVDFAIARDGETTHPERCASEIDNTFTHEVGHLIGLDHTCFAGGERLVDDQGDPQPNCSPADALTTEQREATMYNFQDCGETKKASPEADDVAGVCSVYPTAADPGECSTPEIEDKGCCAVAGAHPAPSRSLGILALAALALLWLRRRRSGL